MTETEPPGEVLRPPAPEDGAAFWRIARDSAALDLNSPYAYLLWCRDFAATSVVATSTVEGRDEPAGFVMGYLRPGAADTFVVWQVAVASHHRGRGLALRMLHHLADRLRPGGGRFLEATVTPHNHPSARLFTAFARDRETQVDHHVLFSSDMFPNDHEDEVLYRIGPLSAT
ncbi:MAG: diaminobutyrate acetyltransferase [Streptosporangiaceae bacterium]